MLRPAAQRQDRPGLVQRLRRQLRKGFRTPDKLPWYAFITIFCYCLFVAGLLAFEIISQWDDAPFHALTALTMVLISITAWTFFRRIDAAWMSRQADNERLAAIDASHARSRYLAHISHEMRSPLNAIYGYAQLVERGEGGSPQEAAKVIRRCTEHLTSLVEGLLDISQVQNGVLRIKSDVVQPALFLDQIVAMMRPAAIAKGLAFHYDASSRLPPYVRLDQSRFRQVLVNLLTNAIKYTDSGSVTLRVRYTGQIARFEIIDTGPGISDADRERIFDPYDRGGGDEVQTQPGLGLGLPISRAIIDILGGNLELESQPGKGSCFRVSMMLGEIPGPSLPAQLSRRVTGYIGNRRSIMVVEDDQGQRQFITSLLCSLGFEVLAMPNGEAAIAGCSGSRFDLAILDISLPGMSGWDTAIQLRQLCSEELHIVMLSANANEFYRPEHETTVHDFFLTKPVEFGMLIEAIGGLLNLSWHYEGDGSEAAQDTPLAASGKQALGETARPHVNRLRELVRIGHVRGIEEEIAQLAAQGGGAESLASELFKHLDRYDLASIGTVLKGV